MEEVTLQLNERNHGAFILKKEGVQIGKMVVSVEDQLLTAYHTEVDQQQEGKGYARLLLNAMIAYARDKKLKVLPLCPYVHAQFKRHPEEFADIWQTNTPSSSTAADH